MYYESALKTFKCWIQFWIYTMIFRDMSSLKQMVGGAGHRNRLKPPVLVSSHIYIDSY